MLPFKGSVSRTIHEATNLCYTNGSVLLSNHINLYSGTVSQERKVSVIRSELWTDANWRAWRSKMRTISTPFMIKRLTFLEILFHQKVWKIDIQKRFCYTGTKITGKTTASASGTWRWGSYQCKMYWYNILKIYAAVKFRIAWKSWQN